MSLFTEAFKLVWLAVFCAIIIGLMILFFRNMFFEFRKIYYGSSFEEKQNNNKPIDVDYKVKL